MSDEPEIPGQQYFDLPDPVYAVRPPRSRRRKMLAGGTVVVTGLAFAGWGVSDALASSAATRGFPHVSHLSAGDSVDGSAAAAAVNKFIVDIDATDGYSGEEDAGTGSIITSNGDVLTNNHVVAGSTSLTVTVVSTGKTYKAKVLGTDATDDVALIKMQGASGLATINAADATAVKQGIAVAAVGNALGKGGTPTVTTGSITGTGRSITASDGDGAASENLSGLLETDADIVSGDSGGPLVDSSGQVIGMDTAAASSGSGSGFESSAITSSSDGYAIPITTALGIARKIANGKASSKVVIGTPGFLGLELGTPSTGSTGSDGSTGGLGDGSQGTDPYGYSDPYGDPYGNGYGDGQGGFGQDDGPAFGTSYSTSAQTAAQNSDLTVAGVVSDSPAARAGIAAGDTITSVNGTAVGSDSALTAVLAQTHGGDRVTVGWTDSAGTSHQATVTLISGPAA
jgi:S1-C subfamily serine protease